MKRLLAGVAMVLVSAGAAFGQNGLSLPIAETAAPAKQNLVRLTGGVSVKDEVSLIGGRVAWAPIQDLLVFGDLGWVDVDYWDSGTSLQMGALYTLPLEVPMDVAVRGTIYKPFIDSDLEILGGTIYGIIGKDFDAQVPGLSVYGGIGLDYSDTDYNVPTQLTPDLSESNTELGFTAGSVFKCADMMSIFAELSYVDGMAFALGGRVDF